MSRTRILLRGLLAASIAATMLGGVPSLSAQAQAASSSEPIMFGAVGASKAEILDHERVLGHRMNGVRVFKGWDSKLFGTPHQWAGDTGHTLFVSIKAKRSNGTQLSFRSIANAKPGSRLHNEMLSQARQIKEYGKPVYIVFNHEPEAWFSRSSGGPEDFKAAWRKVINTYRQAGVKNAEYVWTMTGYGFVRKDKFNARNYYPGDAYVDHIAADVYNWYKCRGPKGKWTSLAQLIEGHRQFGLQHPSKGLMILEYGSVEDKANPGRKAQWIRDSQALFKQAKYSQYEALLQWGGRTDNGDNSCHFDYLTSKSATSAWKAMGNDHAYRAEVWEIR